MKNINRIKWLWSIVVFILLFSWVMVGQNTPTSNTFHGAINVNPSTPVNSILLDSTGAVFIGPSFGTLGLNEISSGNVWVGSNVTPNGGAFKYKVGGAGAVFQITSGKMLFRTFVPGTPGGAATPKTPFSIDNAAPDGSLVVNPQGATVAAFGMQVATVATTSEPTCSATVRGTFWVVQGAAGVKDQVSVCAKDATDAYAWRTIF